MTAILLAIFTFIGWGTGDIFSTLTARRIGALRASVLVSVIMVFFMAAAAPFAGDSPATSATVWQSIGLGALLSLSYLSFTSALRTGNPAVVGSIAGAFIALVVILSLLFLGETLTVGQLSFIGIIMTGVTTTSLDWHMIKERAVRWDKSVLLAFATMVGWGIYFTFIKIPIRESGWYWPTLLNTVAGAVLLLVIYVARRNTLERISWKPGLRPALLVVAAGGSANITYNVALQYGNASIVAPIAGSYVALFVLLASRIFEERVTRQQAVGIVVTLVGIVGLSILSA